jgi:serine protease Do
MQPSFTLSRSPRLARSATASWAIAAAMGLGTLSILPVAQAQLAPNAVGSRTPVTFADIVDRVKGSVVSVHVVGGGGAKVAQAPAPNQKGAPPRGRGAPDQPFGGIPGLPDDHPLNEFFKNLPRGGGGGGNAPALAQGSGFVISDDGYVVTNNHVIENATKIQLSFDDASAKVDAELVGTDQRTDIALLKIKGANRKFAFVKLAPKDPRVGDWVVAVGNPFGFGGTVTAGIVSALARDVGSGPYDYLQIDAAVNRGNSGGPTFNLDGEVIGVNTAIYSPSGGSVGIAFAVPAKTVTEVVNQLKTSGSVSRGWLGVKIQNVDEDTAASLGLGETRGALINEVTPDGPAARSGLKNGDTILTVNGEKIADSRDLARKIAALAPNATADVVVLRGGKEQPVPVKLGDFKDANGPTSTPAKADVTPKPTATTDLEALGLKLSAGKTPRDGVSIVEVDSNSDAALKGLRAGDVIIEVSSLPVASVDDVSKGLAEASKLGRRALLLRVRSGDQTRFVAVQLKKG